MLDESSLTNSERIESDHCDVEDNDIHAASYNDFAKIPQCKNELNDDKLHFSSRYFSSSESDARC